jgi:hypothetical protein
MLINLPMTLSNTSDIGEVMRKVVRFMSWWLVTATFVAFAAVEIICVYYAMMFLGMLPK